VAVRYHRLQNKSGHFVVKFRHVGAISHRCVVPVVEDDLAPRPGKTDGLAQQGSGICNMTNDRVGKHQIVLALVSIAALAVRLIIFNIFQPGFCREMLCSFNQTG